MRRILCILAFLLVSCSAYGQEWVYSIEKAELQTQISAIASIHPTSNDYSLKEAVINLSFFPRDEINQNVISLLAVPEPENTGKALQFRWDEPSEEIKFKVSADVEVNAKRVEVREKVNFPLDNVPPELGIYIQPSETIDSDNEGIIKIASELSQGEDDEYAVLFKLAEWTKNNVKYDLSTLTAEASQKASWVLETKEGVCDEITTLFIAMCRAVGIPARFVSGVAYTNFGEDFGPHGWAEAYLPNYGWVPFDVTYGEFGFINPLHIKMQESVDSAEPSTSYNWLGRNVDLETRKLSITTKIINKEETKEIPLAIKLSSLKSSIGFGSYNLIEGEIENLKDYYYTTEAYLVKSKEVEVIGDERQQILLQPHQTSRVYWIIKIEDTLNNNYLYTFPFEVRLLGNITAQTGFSASKNSQIFSLAEIGNLLKQKKEEKEKVYSKDLLLECTPDKQEIYEYEKAKINCTLKNTGNVLLEDLNVCLEEDCTTILLGIGKTKVVEFFGKYAQGKQEMIAKAENNEVSKIQYVDVKSVDMPKVEIAELQFPEKARFNDTIEAVFILSKASDSVPQDVIVVLDQNGIKKEWNIKELFRDEKFAVQVMANKFSMESNKFTLSVNYKDKNGAEYKTERSFNVALEDLEIADWPRFGFNKLANYIEGADIARFINILIFVTISFIGVIIIVFRKGKK